MRYANPDPEPPMSSSLSFVVISNAFGSAVRVPSTFGVEAMR
jgi:hypothetical protein